MESATVLILVVLLLVLWTYNKTENYSVEERVKILEKRVDDLYSGGADLRKQSVYTGTNQ